MHDFGPTSNATVYVDVGAARPPMVTCKVSATTENDTPSHTVSFRDAVRIPDAEEGTDDTDGDGTPNYLDV
eukprot:COSAG02_NODE_42726_length_382_cov_0.314488_1_plen_70_part_01